MGSRLVALNSTANVLLRVSIDYAQTPAPIRPPIALGMSLDHNPLLLSAPASMVARALLELSRRSLATVWAGCEWDMLIIFRNLVTLERAIAVAITKDEGQRKCFPPPCPPQGSISQDRILEALTPTELATLESNWTKRRRSLPSAMTRTGLERVKTLDFWCTYLDLSLLPVSPPFAGFGGTDVNNEARHSV